MKFAIVGLALCAQNLTYGATLYQWDASILTNGTYLSNICSTAREPSVCFSDSELGGSQQVTNGNVRIHSTGINTDSSNNAYADITDCSSGTYWLVCELSGWTMTSFGGASGGLLDLYFNSNATINGALSGIRLNGQSSSLNLVLMRAGGNTQVATFSTASTTPLKIALELNLDTAKTALHYQYGTNSWVSGTEYNAISSADFSHVRLSASYARGDNEMLLKRIEVINHPPWEADKLVISGSMQCFPYYRSFSNRINFADRPLDWDPRMSGTDSHELKLLRMEQAGVDVCAKLVVYGDGTPSQAMGAFGGALDAAAGSRVRVAPEFASLRATPAEELGNLADFFKTMIETYGDDPRWLRYDGKLVVFLWNPFDDNLWPFSTSLLFGPQDLESVWEDVGAELRSKLYVINESYYMANLPDTYVTNHWNEDGYVEEMLTVTDDIFWWHSWADRSREEARTTLLADSIRDLTDAPVIIGARPGYYRKNVGLLNPHDVSGKFRELWDANMGVDPDWIYLCLWDDYAENTLIEPSRINRGFYSSVAYASIMDWRGITNNVMSAETWIGMPLCVMRGNEIRVEVVQMNTDSYSQVSLALEDKDGQQVYCSSGVSAESFGDLVRVFPFTVETTQSEFDAQQVLVPVVYATSGGTVVTNRGMSPIRLTRHHPMNPLFQYYRLDQLREPDSMQLSYTSVPADGLSTQVSGEFEVSSSQFDFARVELRDLNNYTVPFSGGNFPVISAGTNEAFYLPLNSSTNEVDATFSFNTTDLLDASAMTYLFVEYTDGCTWAGSPKLIEFSNTTVASTVYDLGEVPIYTSVWNVCGSEALSVSEACIADWDFGNYDAGEAYNGAPYIPDSGLYGFPLYLGYGPNTRTYKGTTNNYPEYNAGVMEFNTMGDQGQVLRLPDFALSPGAVNVEMDVLLLNTVQEQDILWHRQGGLTVKLENGYLYVIRGLENNQISLQSTRILSSSTWYNLQVGDTGGWLYICIDGQLDASAMHSPLELKESVGT